MSVLGQSAQAPGRAAVAAGISNDVRAARIQAVRDALTGQLAELDALGLMLAAAMLDNAIAEIR